MLLVEITRAVAVSCFYVFSACLFLHIVRHLDMVDNTWYQSVMGAMCYVDLSLPSRMYCALVY